MTKTIFITPPISTTWTLWGSITTLYRHSTFCSKTDKLHIIATRYPDIYWTWYCTTGRLVKGHWNYCRSNIGKQDQTFSSKIKRFTTHINYRGYYIQKSWDNIKDLLQLKICNSHIHTSISCFMKIQQKEKESLATFMHHFKKEAKRCNFMNNATSIRIFFKGLKSAHNLVAHIYEKGPQTLTDVISGGKKLHALQQLTATLIPPSTVNVMSHEEDCCSQCQESSHIAHHCPNVHCFKCNEYGYIVVDCPHRIPPSGTPAHHHRSQSQHRHHNTSTSHHHPTDRHRSSRSRSQSQYQIYHSQSHHKSFIAHSRSHHRDNRRHCRSSSWWQHSNTSTQCSCHDTLHQRFSSHRCLSAYSWDHNRSCSQSAYRPANKTSHQNSSHSRRPCGNTHNKRNPRVTIDDPQMDFYSSEDNSSDSEGDSDHLN